VKIRGRIAAAYHNSVTVAARLEAAIDRKPCSRERYLRPRAKTDHHGSRQLAAETSVEDIVAPPLSDRDTPRLVVIDPIQTMWTDAVESAPGTVTQVRGAAQAQIRFAKRSGAALILVGHVTKDG
jgi:predicted ATP-dependent serine protease